MSQIVSGRGSARALLKELLLKRGIPRLCVVAHDHAYAGVPESGCGVTITPPPVTTWSTNKEQTGISLKSKKKQISNPWKQEATRLETTVLGTSMAMGIQEYLFDGVAFVQETERMIARGVLPHSTRVILRRPFEGKEHHWLLRSLVFLVVTATTL